VNADKGEKKEGNLEKEEDISNFYNAKGHSREKKRYPTKRSASPRRLKTGKKKGGFLKYAEGISLTRIANL